MATSCSCGATKCGALPSGDLWVSEAVRLLLHLGAQSHDNNASFTLSKGSLPVPFAPVASSAVAEAVDAVVAEAVAAATAKSESVGRKGQQTCKHPNRQWVIDVWKYHLSQHPDLQTGYFHFQNSSCRVRQLTALQLVASSLLQAAESLLGQTVAKAAIVGGDSAATAAAGRKNQARAAASATPKAARQTSCAPPEDATASHTGEGRKDGNSSDLRSSTKGTEPPGGAACEPATVALTVLYGQLCCWLLHQLQSQQLQLVLLSQRSSGVEGRLQRLSRLLCRVLATLRPLSASLVGLSKTKAFPCPSALLCRCWQETEKGRQQQPHEQQSKEQEVLGSCVVLCFARRFLQSLTQAAVDTPNAAATPAAPAAAPAGGAENIRASPLAKLSAFVAAEIPCSAFLASLKDQAEQREHQQHQDLFLLYGPLQLCASTLLDPKEEDTEEAGTAAECLSWALSSLGDLALSLPCMQYLLVDSGWDHGQPQPSNGILVRLLRLLPQHTGAVLPLSSLFVQLLLARGAPAPSSPEGAHPLQPHRCRSLLIALLLDVLMQQGKEQKEAVGRLLRCVGSGAAGADDALISECFSGLPSASRAALLRAVLLQQREEVGGESDSRRQRRQQEQPEQEKDGGDGRCCCTYTSPTGQQQQQLLLLRSIFALRRGDSPDEECSVLLLLHLWLERAPQIPLLQVLQHHQQLQLVADAALRCWQHPRRTVQSAARGLWTLLQQRCSEGASVDEPSSSCDKSDRCIRGSLLEALCLRLFGLPTASRKALYQALASLVHALGAPRVLQLQPLLLPHLLSQLQNRPLRSAAMLVLRALCEELSVRDKQQQKVDSCSKQGIRHQQKKQETAYSPSRGFRAFLLGPLRDALTAGSSGIGRCPAVLQQQHQEGLDRHGYPLLLPLEVQGTGDPHPAEALAETVLPLLMRLEPSAAAPLLLALSAQLPLEDVENAAGATPSREAAGEPNAREVKDAGRLSSVLAAPMTATKSWSPGEAALLATARAAGLATWEELEGGRRSCSSCSSTDRHPCLVVRGCTSSGAPICYRVSLQRLRRGLSSGDKYLRLRLLEALTLHPQSTATPRCEELQLLLYAARQQLRLGSAAERSQFVAAFERVLIRGRNANRLTLEANTPDALRSLADKGCCWCSTKQHSEPQRQQQSLQQQTSSRDHSLGCLLLFLRRLHSTCLLACYPGAPPDRVMVALAILVVVYSLWGLTECSGRHRKKSTAAQAAAAESSRGVSGCTQMPKDGALRGGAVAEALGWRDWPVRSQLLALLPVVAGPAPRKLVMQLLQLLPQQQQPLCYSVSMEQQEKQRLVVHPMISPADCITRSVQDACLMLMSLRQDECAAGALHLQLLLSELFLTPLEPLMDFHQPAQGGAASPIALTEETKQSQAIFCAVLGDALHCQFAPALQHQIVETPPAAPPTEQPKLQSDAANKGCPCHPANGLLAALTVLTEAAETRLAVIRTNPMAVTEPHMGLHGVLSALELALATINPSILRLPCSSTSNSSSNSSSSSSSSSSSTGKEVKSMTCSSAICAWSSFKERLLPLLDNTCRIMSCFSAAADDEDSPQLPPPDSRTASAAADGADTETSQGNDTGPSARDPTEGIGSSSAGNRQRQLQVDCRGHPFISGEDGGDHEETQQMLAFCSWRAVKAATGCLGAFWRAAAFDEGPELLGDGREAASAPDGSAPSGVAAPAAAGSLHRHQQPLLRLAVAEVSVLGTSLIKSLLSCRHMGAVEFLSDALAALCTRVRGATTEDVRSLNRLWVDSILVLLLTTPSDRGSVCRQQQQQQQQEPSTACAAEESDAETPGDATCFLRVLGLPLSRFAGDGALPPPLRKSKSLGLAMIAILGLGQGTSGTQFDAKLLSHVLSCLLPLAEGRVSRLFASQREAFGAQVHALNLLKSLIAASAPAAGADVREASAIADAAVAASQTGWLPGSTTSGVPQQRAAGGAEEADRQEAPLPLAIAALGVAVKGTASVEFPVRSSANALLVAATKRLAGTDDETQRVPAAPFVFCSGAAMRGSTGTASGLLCIDAGSLSLPQLRPLVAMALLPLMKSNEKVSGQQHQFQPDDSMQRPQLQLLIRGLAAHGPPGSLRFAEGGAFEREPQESAKEKTEEARLQEEAAVAVLLLLARADLNTLSPDRPRVVTLLYDSLMDEVISELRDAATTTTSSDASGGLVVLNAPASAAASKHMMRTADPALQPHARGGRWGLMGSSCAAEGACAAWLRLLLRSLCCCLRAVPFASRALAARALASYVIQLAQTEGAQGLVETIVGTATLAARAYKQAQTKGDNSKRIEESSASTLGAGAVSPISHDAVPEVSHWQDPNARSGLLLLLLELLGRPEAPSLFAEAAGAGGLIEFSDLLRHSATQLQLVALSRISGMERVLALQAMHALATVSPAEDSEVLWSLAAAATRKALGIADDETHIDAARVAEAAHDRGSVMPRVGLPAVQVAALRILMQCHLRPPNQHSVAANPGAAAQAHLMGLTRVAAVLHAALALAVHPQAVEAALRSLAKATNAHAKAHRQRLRLSLEINGSSEAPPRSSISIREREAKVEFCCHSVQGFFDLWEQCIRLLENPVAADSATSPTQARQYWQCCYLAPLRLAACRALAALAVFAAPYESLCKKLCEEQSERAAAAAASLSGADYGNEGARVAQARMGAALLLCAENEAARQSQEEAARRSSISEETAAPPASQSPGVCFGHPRTRWAAHWASALLRCAQPTQNFATRMQAAKALAISGLPAPCAEHRCAGNRCAGAKLRIWRATLLLLQDEDVCVRESAGAAASAAAATLHCRLYSASDRTTSTSQAKDVQVLLAAAASPALSEEPHGVEAGALMQLLVELLSKMFPPAISCTFLWRLLREGSSRAVETCARRFGINLQGASDSALGQEMQNGNTNRRLFDEEPPNMYADPALSAQLAARSLVLILLQHPCRSEAKSSHDPSTASWQESGASPVGSGEAGPGSAVRLAVTNETSAVVSSTGAVAAAMTDLSGTTGDPRTKWSCRHVCSRSAGSSHCSCLTEYSEAWLAQAADTAASDVLSMQMALDAFTLATAMEGGPCIKRAESAGELLLHATQHWLFLPVHTALLRAWILVVFWAAQQLPMGLKAITDLRAAIQGLLISLQRAAAGGQMPHPQVLDAGEALADVMACLNGEGFSSRQSASPLIAAPASTAECRLGSPTTEAEPSGEKEGLSSSSPELDLVFCAAAGARRLASACLFLLVSTSPC